MPEAPWAWAATFMPAAWASSTTACISARVICWAPGDEPREKTPPVAQILITSAPYLRIFRTIFRASSGLSTTAGLCSFMDGGKKVESQCPPVAPMA